MEEERHLWRLTRRPLITGGTTELLPQKFILMSVLKPYVQWAAPDRQVNTAVVELH